MGTNGNGEQNGSVFFRDLSPQQQDFFLKYAPRSCLGRKGRIFKERFCLQFPELRITDEDFSRMLKYRRFVRSRKDAKKAASDRQRQLSAETREYWKNRRKALISP